MKKPDLQINSALAVERLTALWALNEAGLGGIMHAFRTPFTGVFVGGFAIILIALIAHFAEKKSVAIIRATFVVLIVKALVSPHSPLAAYIAVGFQGFAGAIIFSLVHHHKTGSILLGLAGLLESALQKVLILTILFGTPLWESIDVLGNQAAKHFRLADAELSFSLSRWLVGAYLGVYFIGGLLVGWIGGILPNKIKQSTLNAADLILSDNTTNNSSMDSSTKKPLWKSRLLQFSLLLVLIYLLLHFFAATDEPVYRATYIFIRASCIILAWYILIAPFLLRWVKKVLRNKQNEYGEEVEKAMNFLPVLRSAVQPAWKQAKGKYIFGKLFSFLLILITFALTYEK